MNELLGYATYVPAYRFAPGSIGNRIVASFDEDSTTMAVDAARLLTSPARSNPTQLLLCTSTPAYMDKTNATAVHAALGLDEQVPAADMVGTARSSVAAIRSALSQGGLVAMADVRVGKPGSGDERTGADLAAALLFGQGPGIAEILAVSSTTAEFLDRWREPNERNGSQWEERFGSDIYRSLVVDTAARALSDGGLEQADHVVVTSGSTVVRKAAMKWVRGRLDTTVAPVGFSGASDVGVALASVLDIARAGETVLVLSAVDGCDAILLRTTDLLPERRQQSPLTTQLRDGLPVDQVRYLGWRGLVDPELPRRPEPSRPAGPPSARGAGWKFSLDGSRCTVCQFMHLPPARVCRECGIVDAMATVKVSDKEATVATFTVDRLAYSPSPPLVGVIVDFDGGGRCALEVADTIPDELSIGDRVDLVFRRMYTAGGVHNYFWKARVIRPPAVTRPVPTVEETIR
ncbi:Hydroxymethylglutaryl-CoA synthase [Rhodococcus sp. B7740]|uniref:OB-fold domain-containing protein n=1 Tax=Rhodococcus sp. B7740 TaxID=1564114 RepID=UPI0005D88288|nr:OB-fold domain-containing protein [Rhodococcus sp. B7740]AJW40301.1 Hydroxymethylglutaryl-CoA synthase [Rhodococcus sp. B7740]